ncbi:MAG: valine--tRNA ligase [Patescibacteria group bacterium]
MTKNFQKLPNKGETQFSFGVGAYDPKLVEEKIYSIWEKSGFFNPDNLPAQAGLPKAKEFFGKAQDKNYIIYMPLPNVTGTLHMGHLLNNTLQDVLIRYERMRGKRALYLPGTDHAGIATQFVVEKELKKEGINRWDLGREKFIARVWEWKNKYGDLIFNQLRKIGVSADWSRARFTMDQAYSDDILKTFVHYYEKGWVYQGLRTVNWCPRCGTSLSELELEYADEKTTLYYIKYGSFTLATTRPETKFGDTALAVNPKDERYKKYIGETIEVDSLSTDGELEKPEIKKIKLQIVGDDVVDIEFGTGVVKVTPAHDILDFEIGERHKLPMIQVINERGRMNESAGKYAGLKTTEARKKIVEDMKSVGLLVKEELYDHRIAKCYRCNTVIEPIPSKQWFLKMKELAKLAKKAVENGKVEILPKNFEKPYFDWLENIRDWTISRQIWWGHQLPVYYCKCADCDHAIVSLEQPKSKCPKCDCKEYRRSEEVLDTWFSSALWPFAGLSASDLKNYYPGNALITARDILNLWVARMIFSGLEFQGKLPFSKVFIHGTILTKEGKRMSKSLGTGVDPLKYINEYGADATRFGIIWQANGQDIHWDETSITAGRKFCNKIWNASKFVLSNVSEMGKIEKFKPTTEADKKIIAALEKIKISSGKNIETFNFSEALHEIYDFFWHDFCDEYLEIAKSQLAEKKTVETTKKILSYAIFESLKIIHPFMPFVTEEIYGILPIAGRKLLMIEKL